MNEQNKNGNIFGLGFNIDPAYLEGVIKEIVNGAIANAIAGANADEPTKGIINAALNVKVRKDNGALADRFDVDGGRACTLLEYYVRNAIQDVMKDVMKEVVTEQRPMFKELIKKSLASKKTQANIVESFLTSLMDNMSCPWQTNVDIKFAPPKGLC